MILSDIDSPEDLRAMTLPELEELAREIRDFLIGTVTKTGGHLGPNLGVVELTIALHRIFTSPEDTFVFDTGHQAYVHKMLTGRRDDFETLRQLHGLSGYPSRTESPHDFMGNSHASTGLSYALAVARAKRLKHETGKTICVVGDGSLTGGMAYEALNNIGQLKPELVIILNDNGRSYAPTVGGMAENLAHLRLSPRYEAAKGAAGSMLKGLPVVGNSAYMTAKRMKDSLKQLVSPLSVFETLGIKYGGPIDGHDITELERALLDAAEYQGPVVIHIVTEKGHGYAPAIEDEIDKLHAVSARTSNTSPSRDEVVSWTDAFGELLLHAAEEDNRIVAITAAMASSTGLLPFAARFPDRFYDVGIAEQHAVTFATGLALSGLRPVVCIYSSFLQRAFDQVICDTALHNAPVLFVLDRAGITGEDGASHHGMFDLAYLRTIPGMTIAAPSSITELSGLLTAGLHHDGPFAIRFPKGLTAPIQRGTRIAPIPVPSLVRVRHGNDIALMPIGKMVALAKTAAEELANMGIEASVIDARFAKPLSSELVDIIASHRAYLTIEDGVEHGGFGSAVQEATSDAGIFRPSRRLGLPDMFLEHGPQSALLELYGLNTTKIVAVARELLAESNEFRYEPTHHNVKPSVTTD